MEIKIIRFKITGFKSLNKITDVYFSDDNASVIFGGNGSGKTTFLKALASFLKQDEHELFELGIIKAELEINFNNVKKNIIVERKKGEENYNWSKEAEILKQLKSLSLGVERGVSTQNINIPEDFFYEYFRFSRLREMKNISNTLAREISFDLSQRIKNYSRMKRRRVSDDIDFEVNHLYIQNIKMDNIEDLILSNFRKAKYKAAQRIQNALFDTLSEVIDIESGNSKLNKENLFNFDDSFFEILTEKKNQIIESISISEHNSFKNGVLNILQNIENKEYQDKIKENKLLRQMFKNIIDELNNEELHLSSINYLVDTFNFFLSDDKKFEINVNEIIVKIGDIAHSIHDLSSGERHMLTFLSLVLFVGSGRNFLIIDEPEISLNMKWQRQLIELFKIMLPNVQIIVASHSPFLAKNQPNMLCKFENKVV